MTMNAKRIPAAPATHLQPIHGPGEIPDDETLTGIGAVEEKTTLYGRNTGRVIPFGSTLALHALRVSLDRGTVKLALPDGRVVGLGHMPVWEQAELMHTIDFALETGSL